MTTISTETGAWESEDEGLTEQEMEFLSDEPEEPAYEAPAYSQPAYYAPPPMMPAAPVPPQQSPAGVPPSVAAFAAARATCSATKEQAQSAIRDAVQAGLVQVAQWVLDAYQSQVAQCGQSSAAASSPGMVQRPSGARPGLVRPVVPSQTPAAPAGAAIRPAAVPGAYRPAGAVPRGSQAATRPKAQTTASQRPAARPAIIYPPRMLRR